MLNSVLINVERKIHDCFHYMLINRINIHKRKEKNKEI